MIQEANAKKDIKITNLTEENTMLESSIKENTKKLQSEAQALKEKIEELETTNTNINDRIKEKEDELKKKGDDITQCTISNEMLNNNIRENNEEIQTLKNTLSAQKAEIQNNFVKIEEYDKIMKDTSQNIEELKKNKNELDNANKVCLEEKTTQLKKITELEQNVANEIVLRKTCVMKLLRDSKNLDENIKMLMDLQSNKNEKYYKGFVQRYREIITQFENYTIELNEKYIEEIKQSTEKSKRIYMDFIYSFKTAGYSEKFIKLVNDTSTEQIDFDKPLELLNLVYDRSITSGETMLKKIPVSLFTEQKTGTERLNNLLKIAQDSFKDSLLKRKNLIVDTLEKIRGQYETTFNPNMKDITDVISANKKFKECAKKENYPLKEFNNRFNLFKDKQIALIVLIGKYTMINGKQNESEEIIMYELGNFKTSTSTYINNVNLLIKKCNYKPYDVDEYLQNLIINPDYMIKQTNINSVSPKFQSENIETQNKEIIEKYKNLLETQKKVLLLNSNTPREKNIQDNISEIKKNYVNYEVLKKMISLPDSRNKENYLKTINIQIMAYFNNFQKTHKT